MTKRVAHVFVVALVLAASVRSQDAGKAVPQGGVAPADTARILSPLADGTPSPPAPPPVLPPFKIKSTIVSLVDVEEPPPMSGLPPVTGTITRTVHLVDDPGLPDPPPPAATPPVMDPAKLALFRELAALYVPPQFVSLSVSVYDHKRSLLKWDSRGNSQTGENIWKQHSAWSNVDFSHFTCFSTYEVADSTGTARKYELMMFVTGSYDSNLERKRCAHFNLPYKAPEIPELPDLATAGPAFVVVGGDASDPRALEFIQGLHDLYRVEGQRMEAAYHARIKAEADRRAYLLAHPPKPKDVTVYFWERDHPATPPANVNSTEGSAQ